MINMTLPKVKIFFANRKPIGTYKSKGSDKDNEWDSYIINRLEL